MAALAAGRLLAVPRLTSLQLAAVLCCHGLDIRHKLQRLPAKQGPGEASCSSPRLAAACQAPTTRKAM